MKFTNEQLAKMNAAKTAEELIALAKAEGIEATEEEIKAQFAAMHNEGELSDDELDNVAGGCGDEKPGPQYKAGQRVCGYNVYGYALYYGTIDSSYYVDLQGTYYYWILMDDGKKIKEPLESKYTCFKVIS